MGTYKGTAVKKEPTGYFHCTVAVENEFTGNFKGNIIESEPVGIVVKKNL